ncbi:hypothetical protein BDV25DRAFT_172534 [Aspergillus avenaceus]|uniref:EthD domain-containing protein n=1 Tax=Aspergillus avenaceus TaxID=36643 RepID=A0A5N6TV02_ASPAV|nr:hypothetical protein BDV25DRAFT_172534 [Aspergillus avenaceus]
MAQRLLRLSLAHYRKDSCSEESCHYFGTTLHAKQAATLHAKHGTRQYYQVYSTQATRDALDAFRRSLGADWTIDSHDLTVELYIRDLQTLRNIAADPEFASFYHLEEPYLSRRHVVASLGWVEAYVEEGRVVHVTDEGSEYRPVLQDFVGQGGDLESALA